MMRLKLALFIVFLMIGVARAAPCPTAAWCTIYTNPPANMHQNGWDVLEYSPDNQIFYLLMSNGGGITPESNSFFSYQVQASPMVGTANPWVKVSSCGNGQNFSTQVNRQPVHLVTSITATTGTCPSSCNPITDTIHLQLDPGGATNIVGGTNPLYAGNITNGSGVVWIGNESIRYGKCTSTASFSGPVCSGTSGPDMYLWGTSDGTSSGTQAPLVRGTRTTAGWLAADNHLGGATGTGEPAGWACYNPELGSAWSFNPTGVDTVGTDHATGVGRAGSWDHPPERHAVQNEPYDSKRGRIWAQFGFEESWQWQDTWSLCVADKGGAGGGDALSTCGTADLYTATSTTKGWQRVRWPGSNPSTPLYTLATSGNGYNSGITENATAYDPHDDALIEMGGLQAGTSRNEIFVFCTTSSSTVWGCSGQPAGTWVKLVPSVCSGSTPTTGHYCGNTGTRDGGRMGWDPVNNRMDVFGGVCSGSLFSCPGGGTSPIWWFNSVAQYDPINGDICLSDGGDATHGSVNSTRTGNFCSSLPALTGTPPPTAGGSLANCNPVAGNQNCTLKFPSFTYNSNPAIKKFVFYGGNNSSSTTDGVWLYDPTANAWSHAPVTGGPNIKVAFNTSLSSWGYDSAHDTLVWIQGGGSSSDGRTNLYQLPSAALLASGPFPSFVPNSLTFPNEVVGATSPSQTVTLTNTGTSNLIVSNVAISGDFALATNGCVTTLTPTSSCTVTATFTPTTTGLRTGTISYTDNAGGSPQTVSLSGTGLTSGPIVSLSPSSLSFANQNVGNTSSSQPITLTNTGSSNLTWTTLISFGGALKFSQTNNCTSPLTATASCTINISFTPTAVGIVSGTIIFTDNASDSPQSVSLSGTGVTPNSFSSSRFGPGVKK